MSFKLTREVAEELIVRKGEARGTIFKTDERFIINIGGEEKLEEVESEIKKVTGKNFSYKKINTIDFYPLGLRVISLLAIAKVLELNNDGIMNMGLSAPKVSPMIKLFTQYFLSKKQTFRQVSRMWSRHYTVGDLKPIEINEKEKFLILELQDFNIHPIVYIYLSGYFLKVSEMVVKSGVSIDKMESSFNSADSYIFKIKW